MRKLRKARKLQLQRLPKIVDGYEMLVRRAMDEARKYLKETPLTL